jgi:hypothetical protein
MSKKFLYGTTAARRAERIDPAVTAGASVTTAVKKFLYPTREAKAAIGCGTTTFYRLINEGWLKAVRLGHRTYVTAASLETFVASLPPVVTPTMAKTEHDRWSGHRRARPNPQGGEPGAT